MLYIYIYIYIYIAIAWLYIAGWYFWIRITASLNMRRMKEWGAGDRTQAIAVPFLLFLFHTTSRHLWFIYFGARGSTANHRPVMELLDPDNKFPSIIKKVRRGKRPHWKRKHRFSDLDFFCIFLVVPFDHPSITLTPAGKGQGLYCCG